MIKKIILWLLPYISGICVGLVSTSSFSIGHKNIICGLIGMVSGFLVSTLYDLFTKEK